jgi:hypothetical protein
MTERTSFHVQQTSMEPDFSELTNLAAIARVRQLAAQGLPDDTIAMMVGWNRTDTRRAITPAPQRPNP